MAITAIHPYLHFNGNCEEAFRHYERVLGGTCTGLFRYRDAPPEPNDASNSSPADCGPLPADFGDKVMNVELRVGELVLMGSDSPPSMWQAGAASHTVSIQCTDDAEAERLFAGLMEGDAKIVMPMGETFWASRFGMGTDRFGTPWMVNRMRESVA